MNSQTEASITFLSSLFPSVPKNTFSKLLESHNHNLESVVERLLETDGVPEGDQEDPLERLYSLFPLISADQINSTWLRLNGDMQMVAEQLLNPEHQMQGYTRINPPKLKQSKDTVDSSTNAESLIGTLRQIFPDHSDDFFLKTLEENHFDVEKCAILISQWTLENPPVQAKSLFERHVGALLDIFPCQSRHTLEEILHREGSVDAAVEYLSENQDAVPVERETCLGDCIESGFPCLLHASSQSHILAPKQSKEKQKSWTLTNDTDDQALPKFNYIFNRERQSESQSASSSRVGDVETQDPRALRLKADQIRQERNELYRKACQSFKRGDVTGYGSAAYYSEEVLRYAIANLTSRVGD